MGNVQQDSGRVGVVLRSLARAVESEEGIWRSPKPGSLLAMARDAIVPHAEELQRIAEAGQLAVILHGTTGPEMDPSERWRGWDAKGRSCFGVPREEMLKNVCGRSGELPPHTRQALWRWSTRPSNTSRLAIHINAVDGLWFLNLGGAEVVGLEPGTFGEETPRAAQRPRKGAPR